MSRTCPKCQREILSSSGYFCYFCGARLRTPRGGKGNLQQQVSVSDDGKSRNPTEPGLSLRWKLLVGGVVTLVLVVGLWWTIRSGGLGTPEMGPGREETPVRSTFDFTLDWPVAVFAPDNLSRLVPAGVDFYWEGFGATALIEQLLGEEELAEVEQELGLEIGEAADLLGKAYVIFARQASPSATSEMSDARGRRAEISWGFLAKIKAQEFVVRKIEELEEGILDWQIEEVDGCLLVSNQPDLSVEVEEVATGTVESIAATPGFSDFVEGLPRSGQARVFLPNFKGGFQALVQLLNLDKYRPLLEAVEQGGLGAFVITKEGEKTRLVDGN